MNTGSTNTQLAGFNSAFSPYMQQALSVLNLQDLPKEDRLFGTVAASNLATHLMQQDPEYQKRQVEVFEPMFQRRAEQQMKYGMMSNAFASLLKDVPAAIKNYAYAGRQYDPARINIAAQPILPASSIPNMTVNIPGRNYFG
jgi:hypothetical protein